MHPSNKPSSDLMIYLPPYVGCLALLGSTLGELNLSSVLDFAAVAILVGGVFVVARYRAALEAVDVTARAWHEERDAAISMRDRLAEDLVKERAVTAALRARPDMDVVVRLLESHESNADKRADRIVAAINGGITQREETK